ncbi:nuclear transport factor 2 family protein [Streptomyces sp. NPDC058955]|uniref:nuclear transport factor 2 family protein n=1 Tax=unclassified Streptomyces TaxID=2593676 RepID=UPI0036607D98
MGTGRRTTVGIAVAAAVAAGVVVTAPAEAEPGGVVAAAHVDCPEARAEVERLEGRLTPNTCAFLRRQITFGEMPTGTPPAADGAGHPRVAAYLDIFDPDASLWEAGGPAQRGPAVIGASIANSLRLVPSLRYEGTDVVADGSTVVFGQRNEVTLKGRTVVYPQIARNVLGDDGRTIQARRYYDRAVLFQDTLPDTAPTPLFDGVTDSESDSGAPDPDAAPAAPRLRTGEIPARLAAWNAGDTSALLGRLPGARLAGPGLDAPLTTDAGRRAYLERLFSVADLRLRAGQVAVGATTTYVEWHGTATVHDGTATRTGVPFGIVERFGPDGEWELYFDTLPLVADQDEIRELLRQLAS